MRLIDAEYLLYGMGIFSERENGAEFMRGVDAVAEMIEKAETISPAAWIPCAERLPENRVKDKEGEDVLYLVTIEKKYKSGYARRYIRTAIYDFDAWFNSANQIEIHADETVLAWQPLPELYRG